MNKAMTQNKWQVGCTIYYLLKILGLGFGATEREVKMKY